MNPVDSDLEEGEILDDSPSSPPCDDKKLRELPQRYVVHEKVPSFQKHKKDCKYAIRYHAKKLTNLKKTPKSKNYHKRHKSTCPREKSRRPSVKSSTNVEKNFLKNGHSFSNHSLIAEIKDSIRDHTIKKQSTKLVSKFEKKNSEAEKIKSVNSKSEKSKENVATQSENNNSLNDAKHCNQPSINKASEVIELSSDSDRNTPCENTSNTSPKDKNEESEDEEELRRIALATFTKRKVIESSENVVKTTECNVPLVPESSDIKNVQISHQEISIPASDNYEVVDMEVDEDIQASIEILDNSGKEQNSEFMEDLFVIDTKPSKDFKENGEENTLPKLHSTRNSSDDDFETDILRAELIESLYRKKGLQDVCTEEEKSNVKVHQKQVHAVPGKKHIGKYKKMNPDFYRKKLPPTKHILRKNVVNKTENVHCNSTKPPSPIPVSKPSERLVIALNEESSSEDSVDSESENPVAKIEALISDCRQKSDSSEQTQQTIANVPKAVSCLSKSQQEEYTSLKKILAEKEKLQGPSDTFKPKNGSVRSPLDDLKLMEKKLIVLNETLKKKKECMPYLLKEINSKKSLYMKSKTAVQCLKEQYAAAEKSRKEHLCAWSKSCSDFKSLKKTVSDLENKIIELQKLCSKVGASSNIQGQTYNLSSLHAGNR